MRSCRKRQQTFTGEATLPALVSHMFGSARTSLPIRRTGLNGWRRAQEVFPRFPCKDRERTGGFFQFDYPAEILVVNDHGNHYNWEPNVDLTLADFIALLATVEPAFRKVS